MQTEVERFIHWVRMRSPQARTWRDYRCDLELFRTVISPMAYWVLVSPHSTQRAEVRAFADWLAEQAVATRAVTGEQP